MRGSVFAAAAVLIMTAAFPTVGAFYPRPCGASSEMVEVVDSTGRKVAIKKPVERVVAINTSSAVIMRALGVDIDKVVVGVTKYIPENARFWPRLKAKPSFKFTNINYESLAELNPRLVILYKNSWMYTDETKLKALGIQWLYMDCNDPRDLERDIDALARLFDKEKEAGELVAWVKKYDRTISDRGIRLPSEEKPRIFYYLFAISNLPRGIYSSVNHESSLDPMMARAGGTNIASSLERDHPKLSPEWILEKQPQVIIADLVGRKFTGYNVDMPEALENMRELAGRIKADKALSDTEPAKNDRVLVIPQDYKQGPAYVIGMACMAKFLHPELFRDLDVEAVAREYYERWCGLPYKGIYAWPPVFSSPGKKALPEAKSETAKTPFSIVDNAGRKVEFQGPVERFACLHTSSCNQLSLLGLDDRVVGVTEYIREDPNQYPGLKDKPNIGSVYAPNYEIILETSPEVLIMGSESTHLTPAVEKLSPMGIKVLALDLQPREGADPRDRESNYDRQLAILGKVAGKEERAREFIAWKTGIFDMIAKRTDGARKVRVLCINSVNKVLKGSGFSAWAGDRIIELAGGINLAAGYGGKQISGEWIVEQDPEVILVVSYWPEEGLGYGVIDDSRARRTSTEVSENRIFASSRAAAENKLYLFAYYGLASGGQTPVGAVYLAKRLYPERFRDVDPEKIHKEYMERWFDLKCQGVWFYP